MDTLEEWARLEELDQEISRILGHLFMEFPTDLEDLITQAAELHGLLDNYPREHEVWRTAEAFLYLFVFQKYLRDSENPQE